MFKKLLPACALFIIFTFSVSELEMSPSGTIKRLIYYSKYGNGDIFVSLNSNGATCSHGYFVNKYSAGYESTLNMLLAAYHAKSPVMIRAYEGNRWSGSGAYACEIYSV